MNDSRPETNPARLAEAEGEGGATENITGFGGQRTTGVTVSSISEAT
jgi:hypothetical protein